MMSSALKTTPPPPGTVYARWAAHGKPKRHTQNPTAETVFRRFMEGWSTADLGRFYGLAEFRIEQRIRKVMGKR